MFYFVFNQNNAILLNSFYFFLNTKDLFCFELSAAYLVKELEVNYKKITR